MIFRRSKTKRFLPRPSARLILVASVVMAASAPAQIVVTGNYSPTTPSDYWTGGGGTKNGTIGGNTDGTLTVAGGSVLNLKNAYFGSGTSSGTATVTLTGSDSQIAISGTLYLGNKTGTGNMTISDGAFLYTAYTSELGTAGSTASGTLTINGAGSLWTALDGVYVGKDGYGSLTIQNQGEFNGEELAVGLNDGSIGHLFITGNSATEHSTVTLSLNLIVDGGSDATISNGGQVYAGTSGVTVAGSLLLEGNGSLVSSIADFHVSSNDGAAVVTVRDGAVVNVRASYFGTGTGSFGTVNVTGSGSEWRSSDEARIGRNGGGAELNINQGGYFGSASYLHITAFSTVNVQDSGSTFAASVLFNEGGLRLEGGALLDISDFIANANELSILSGSAATIANGFGQTVDGSTVVDGGTLSFSYFRGSEQQYGNISITDPEGGSALTVGADNVISSTFAGVIEDYTSGPGSVTKTGTNTITLTGDNTYSGGTTINAGTLQLGDGGTTGSILGDVVDNGTLAFNRSDASLTFSGAISGTGGVTQNGSGVLSLTGSNSFTGDVTINSGQILLGSASEFAANTVVNNTTDGLDLNSLDATLGGLAGTGDLALGSQSITVGGNDADTTYSGALSGTGEFTKAGAGTLTLSGASTFSGATTVNAGTLFISSDSTDALANSAVTIETGATLAAADLNEDETVFTLGSLAGSGRFSFSGQNNIQLNAGGNNADTTFTGSITDDTSGSRFDKYGEGTLTLLGADIDLDTLEVAEGKVVFDGVTGHVDNLNTFSNAKLTVQNVGAGLDIGGLYNSGETLITGTGADLTISSNIVNFGQLIIEEGARADAADFFYQTLGATTVVDQASLSFGYFFSNKVGTISISDPTSGGSALTFGQDSANTSTFAGVIEDYINGSGSVTKVGTNTIILTGANTYTGTTTISDGTLQLGHALALQNSTVSIGVDDGLDLNGFAATLGGLAGTGNLALGSQALTVGGNGDSTTYTGILSGTGGSLSKTGDGTLVLTGTNTYTGGTSIDGGTLQLGDGGTTGIVTGDILNIGTLTIDRTDDFTFSGLISGTGDLAKLGTGGDLTLSAANTFTGTTTIEEGRIFLGNTMALQNSTVELSRGYSLGLNSNSATLGALSGTGAIYVSGTRTLTVGGNGADTTYSGSIQGDGGANFQKQGNGMMVLTGTNTYTGTTTISAGTLQIGDGGTTGSIVSTAIANDGALIFDRSDALTYAGVISGSGTVEQAGFGTLTLSGDNTFTGDTIIDAGAINLSTGDYLNTSLQNSTLEVNVDGGLTLAGAGAARIGALRGSGNVDLADNAYELFTGGNGADTTYSGNFINADVAIIYKEGAGTWTLAGTDLDFYQLQVDAGAVVFDGAAATLSRISSAANTQVTFQNGAQVTVSNELVGGSLTVTGEGTDLSVAINLSGYDSLLVKDGANLTARLGWDGETPVTVDAATLTLKGVNNSDSSSVIQINDPTGGTALIFDVTNNINFSGTISDYASGSGSILKTGAGTLTLGGAGTFTGTTTIDEGAINLYDSDYLNSSLQNSTVEVNVDGGLTLADAGAARLGALSGTGNVDLANNGAEVFVGGNGADTTYSGNFINGSYELIHKQGTGTWTLNGTALDLYQMEVNAGSVVFDGAAGTLERIANDAGTSVTFQSGAQITVSTVLTGGALTVTGTGTELSVGSNLSDYSSLRVEDGGHLTASLLTFDSTTPVIVDAATLTIGGIGGSEPASSLQISDPTGGTALIFDVTNDINFGGSISDYTSGSGSVAKTGAGTVRLVGTNTYSGGTTISAGTISADSGASFGTGTITLDGGTLALTAATSLDQAITVNAAGGTLTASSAVTLSGDLTVDGTFAVSNGLILAGLVNGGGGFSGAVTVNGTLSPGNSPGTMTFDNNLTLGDGSTLRIEIGGLSQGTGYDYLDVSGTATLGGTLEVVWYEGYTASLGDTFNFLSADGGILGSIGATAFPSLGNGLSWSVTQTDNDLYLTVLAAVPEPATCGALAGLAALAAACRRRRATRGTDMADCRLRSKPVRPV